MCVVQQEVKFEFLGENDEEMDKNIVDNSYSYFTWHTGRTMCGRRKEPKREKRKNRTVKK